MEFQRNLTLEYMEFQRKLTLELSIGMETLIRNSSMAPLIPRFTGGM